MLKVTGERLLPDAQRGELVHAEHLARYRFAVPLAAGQRVLDAACGEGYGTAMLAEGAAKSAVGVDIDAGTVEHARARYGLDFRCADVAELPFEDASFDLVVSFETIEHVADPERMLGEFHRVMAPKGQLVVSTPNAHVYGAENEFHEREYTTEEFTELLGRHFEATHLVYQQNWLASAILGESSLAADDDAPLDIDFFKTVGTAPTRELYPIAICGGGDAGAARDLAVATGVYEAHRLSQLVRDWNARATEAERQVEEMSATLARIEASVSWRTTKPLRRLKALVRER